MQDAPKAPFSVINSIQSMHGFVYGARSASLLADLDLTTIPAIMLNNLTCAIHNLVLNHGPTENFPEPGAFPNSAANQLVWIPWAVQKSAGIPTIECGHTIKLPGNRLTRLVIPAPAIVHELLSEFFRWVINILFEEDAGKKIQSINSDFFTFFGQLKNFSSSSSNVPHFLAAAAKLNIPVSELAGTMLRFGQGRKARWLDSSFTDQTPHLSAVIARNKRLTAKVLHDAGIPVAPNASAKNRDKALMLANKIGFPVVIKPSNLDRGVGVATGLMNSEEVALAFDQAQKYSKEILVEKHIAGRDYRLNVLHGEILWAIERVPAGVSGDGKHNVKELLDLLNADHRRGHGVHSKLQKILLDDEALGLLHSNGRTPESVPDLGEYVALRRRANISAGGMPVAVTDRVHPDNAKLAIRAAAAVGLDIAGVDLLISDISKSWMDIGGVVCEVNGQPQLGSVTSSHVYKIVLEKLIDGNGRIPITVIVGGRDFLVAQQVIKEYKSKGFNVGYAGRNGIFIGDECINKKSVSSYMAGHILQRDRRVDAIVLEVHDTSMLFHGFPFDFCDQILAGKNISEAEKLSMARLLSISSKAVS